jgi:hypothetical protein
LGTETIHPFVVSKRLGSPQHYRYHFAFAHPVGALADEQVQAFIENAEHATADAIQMFRNLTRDIRPQGGTMAEVLIDRLIAWSDRVPEGAIPGIFAAFADAMDDDAVSIVRDFGDRVAWRSAERAVKVLLKRAKDALRVTSLRTLFTEGRAIGWLTSILRDEIVSHGHTGERPEPEDQWLMTAAELASVLSTMLGRYRAMLPAELIQVPNLMTLLLVWQRGSDTDQARKWVETQTVTDTGLLLFLSRVRGWAASSNIGVYYPLRRRDLENFLDYDDALRRVQAISTRADASEADRQLASELLQAFGQGEQI